MNPICKFCEHKLKAKVGECDLYQTTCEWVAYTDAYVKYAADKEAKNDEQ